MQNAHKTGKKGPRKRGKGGFQPASSFLKASIRTTLEKKGFVHSEVLTRWQEILGAELAVLAHPLEVKQPKNGLGATLKVLSRPSASTELYMRKEEMLRRINAIYGYRAIARLDIQQSSSHGFAEAQAKFYAAPSKAPPKEEVLAQIKPMLPKSKRPSDSDLADALECLAKNRQMAELRNLERSKPTRKQTY